MFVSFVSVSLVLVVGCTNEEDLGGREGDAGATDGETSAPTGEAASPRPPDEAGGPEGGGFGTTAIGESCDPADYPPAPESCRIPGLYDVVESWCAGGVCGSAAPSSDAYRWVAEVTVQGTEVTLTNGRDRLLRCKLDGACDCVRSSGSLIRFIPTGFVGLGKSDCPGSPGVTLYSRDVGKKR